MSRSDYLAAIQAALAVWEQGQEIVEAALLKAKTGERWEDTRPGLSAILDELLDHHHLGAIPKRVLGFDIKQWHPWRAGAKLLIREAYDLEQACEIIVNRTLPVDQQAVDEWASPVREWFAAGIKSLKPSKRRRRQGDPKQVALTPKQTEAVQIYGECKGNFAAAARRLGIDRKSFKERYDAAAGKLGSKAVKHATTQIASDKRGQSDIVEKDDRRR